MKTKNSTGWISLDGSQGEGGGQILRSALTLSMLTGKPFRIDRIRAGRNKPGLLRQHLVAVQAAAKISGAHIEGAALGSTALSFSPGKIKGGDYRFSISSAGSCSLVLQTILPALWFADAPSSIDITGGTHNSSAPPADFLIRCWAPLLERMGIKQTMTLKRHGFYPAGGGEIVATATPVDRLMPLHLTTHGKLQLLSGEAICANIPGGIAQRELDALVRRFPTLVPRMTYANDCEGSGNVLHMEIVSEHLTELLTSFGQRGVSSETVARQLADEAQAYLDSDAAVGEHLADQLVLPMALACASTGAEEKTEAKQGGSFTACKVSSHLTTNIAVVRAFLKVNIEVVQERGNRARVTIGS